MSTHYLAYADRAAAVSALTALGLTTKGLDGEPVLPSVTFAADGSRVDIAVAGGGSGVVSRPTGKFTKGPGDIPVPSYEALPGFRLTVAWSGSTAPDFGSAVTPDGEGVILVPVIAPAVVPDQVPMWAAQAALKTAGKYDAINAAILKMESSNPPVFFAWTMGNYASRESAFIDALASSFDMKPADIDAVFMAAQEIARVAG